MANTLFLEDYILFDCPGQVELFTHHSSLRNIFFKIQKMGIRVSDMTLDIALQCLANIRFCASVDRGPSC